MSYYDNDIGEYVGFDPYDAYEKRIHEEKYHKQYVPTTKDLLDKLYYRSMIDESKKYIEEPSYDGDDFFEAYMTGFEKVLYDSWGDVKKTMELIVEDTVKNKCKARVLHTDKEHIVREGTSTYILYERDINEGLKVLGVFYDETLANKVMDYLNEI